MFKIKFKINLHLDPQPPRFINKYGEQIKLNFSLNSHSIKSSMNIDQPLEDVIKAKRQERKSHRKTTQRKRLSGAKQGESKRMAQGAKPVADRVIPRTKDGAALNEEAKKIIISNLPPDVNDHALKVSKIQ